MNLSPSRFSSFLKVPCKYEDLDTTFPDTGGPKKKSEIFAFKRLNRIDNFELFDKGNKYEIDLPNEWAKCAMGTSPAATATADPPEDPPGV